MFCRKCGKEIPDDSEFCPKCGTTVGKDISEQMNVPRDEAGSDIEENTTKKEQESGGVLTETKDTTSNIIVEKKSDSRKKPTKVIAIAIILVVLAAILVSIIIIQNAEAHHEFKYHASDNDSIIIDGYLGEEKEVIIPSTITNKPVTHINESAFENSDIQSITIGENVINIGENAFLKCKDLITVEFLSKPEKLTADSFIIGDLAFAECTSLKEVKMPSTKTTVGIMAFFKCESLSQIDLENVCAFGSKAFFDTGVKEIRISNFGSYGYNGAKDAFRECSNLESVYIGNETTHIPDTAFYNCNKLKNVTWDVNVSNQLATIGKYAFAECKELETITLANGKITKCPSEIDKDYNELERYFPQSGYYIENDAFEDCEKFKDKDPTTQHRLYAGTTYIGKTLQEAIDYADSWEESSYSGPCYVFYDQKGKVITNWCGSYSDKITLVTFDDYGRYLTSDTGKTDSVYIGMSVVDVFAILGETDIKYLEYSGLYHIYYDLYGYNFNLTISDNSRNATIISAWITG